MTEPAEPTPPEAAAKLDALKSDKDWTAGWLAGDLAKIGEFNKLTEIAARGGDKIDLAMAGILEDKIFQDHSHVDGIKTAQFLRDAGIDDPAVIRQVLSNETVSREEFEIAKSTKARLLRDHDFSRRYLSGDGEAVRQMTLLNVILTRDTKSA